MCSSVRMERCVCLLLFKCTVYGFQNVYTMYRCSVYISIAIETQSQLGGPVCSGVTFCAVPKCAVGDICTGVRISARLRLSLNSRLWVFSSDILYSGGHQGYTGVQCGRMFTCGCECSAWTCVQVLYVQCLFVQCSHVRCSCV
jgi:hypothetical protein